MSQNVQWDHPMVSSDKMRGENLHYEILANITPESPRNLDTPPGAGSIGRGIQQNLRNPVRIVGGSSHVNGPSMNVMGMIRRHYPVPQDEREHNKNK